MTRKINILLGIAFFAVCACQKNEIHEVPGRDVTPVASFEKTKAEISDDLTTVSWDVLDSISVLDSKSNNKYLALQKGPASSFKPAADCIEDNAANLFAVFPYQKDAYREGETVVVAVPSERLVESSGLDASACLAVAYCSKVESKTELLFRHVCSFLQFYIPATDDVRSVRLEGGEDEFIAGQVELTVAHNGVPSVKVIDGSRVVTMTSESAFAGTYIIPLLPCTLQNGLAVVFTNSEGIEKKHKIIARDENGVVSAVTLVRGKVNKQALDFEVVPPSVSLGKVFWSEAALCWECSGVPASFNVYLDGQIVDVAVPSDREYKFTGLEPGSSHIATISSVYEGNREAVGQELKFTTGGIRQVTNNISPTSVCVEIDNMVGTYTDNYHPCIYLELLDGEDVETANKIYETYVLDAQIQSPSSPFFGGLAVDNAKSKNPLRIAMGSLEPGSDYWVRVKSVSRYEFKSYVSTTPSDTYAESLNGDSEFSVPIKLSTSATYILQPGDVLFQGFDDMMIHPDYVNAAVGSVPNYKASGKKNTDMLIPTIKSWRGTFSFYGPRTSFASSQIVHYGWASQQTASNDVFTISGGVISGNAPLPGAKIYNFKSGDDALQGWMISNNTYPSQGYVVLGAYYNVSDAKAQTKGMVVTPALESSLLSAQASECELSFKGFVPQGRTCALAVWKYESSTKSWSKVSDIDLFNSTGEVTVGEKWSYKDAGHKWYDHSVTLSLRNGDRIALASDGNGAALLDNICIKIKK